MKKRVPLVKIARGTLFLLRKNNFPHPFWIAKKCFSLVEVIIASAVLLIGVVSLLFVFVSSKVLNELNSSLVIAAVDAQTVLEQVKNVDYTALAAYTPPTFTNLQGETVTVTYSPAGTFTGVTINVTWTQRGRTQQCALTTTLAP